MVCKGKSAQKRRNRCSKTGSLGLKRTKKETTDMDAFLGNAPAEKTETKEIKSGEQETTELQCPNNMEREFTNDIKDQENMESKKEVKATLVSTIPQLIANICAESNRIQTPSKAQISSPSIVGMTPRIANPSTGDQRTTLVQRVMDGNSDLPGRNLYYSQSQQSDGQIGGDESFLGLSESKWPPLVRNRQNSRQDAKKIPQEAQTKTRQALLQFQTPSVQLCQPQGLQPTTTSPVHTTLPQEVEKLANIEARSPKQSVYSFGSVFHIPGQKQVKQPHVQAGGGMSSKIVPQGRGPLPIENILNNGQPGIGIPHGGQTGAQQVPPKSQTHGIHLQQPQGSLLSTLPLSPQQLPLQMGIPVYPQAQSFQQGVYATNQMSPMSQVYYQPGTRQQTPNVQPTAMYQHPVTLPISPTALYMQDQVPLHPSQAGLYQQPGYAMNNQTQSFQFHGPVQGHQGQQNQMFQPNHQPIYYVTQNFYGNPPGPMTQHHGYSHTPQGSHDNWNRLGAGAANDGAPHTRSFLAGGQGSNLQKSQQSQYMPSMSLRLEQTEESHNDRAENSTTSIASCQRHKRLMNGFMKNVDPTAGINMSKDNRDNDVAFQHDAFSNLATLDPQNWSMEMIARFTAYITKDVPYDSESDSSTNNEQQLEDGDEVGKKKQSKQVVLAENEIHDHEGAEKDGSDINESESIIADQTSEENTNVSALQASCEERQDNSSVLEKQTEGKKSDERDTAPKGPLHLKYTYRDDQWSPLNKTGTKVYDREFLIQLQSDPNSEIRPLNLPDLEFILPEIRRNRISTDMKIPKVSRLGRSHSLLFCSSSSSIPSNSVQGALTLKQGNEQDKSKSNEPAIIDELLSIREDVKLGETENAWRPSRLKSNAASEEDVIEALYKKVRQVMNKLMPENFGTLVSQVRVHEFDSPEKLQSVVDLVFKKAIVEPSSMAMYARMCKKFTRSNLNFGKFITTRCQMEFEKSVIGNVTAIGTNDIKEEEKLHQESTEEEQRIRIKSFGNIIFMGELFKQKMFETDTIHKCIDHLLKHINDDSLGCLCKLLSTVGRKLERRFQNLNPYFEQIVDIVDGKVPGKVSPRIRFMLQDLIDLWRTKWKRRKSYSNIETMLQIKTETEEELTGWPIDANVWRRMFRNRPQYAVNISKLENKFKLESTFQDINNSFGSFRKSLAMQKIHEQLLRLMSDEMEGSIENICNWISVNVNEKVSEPEFIKALTIAILEVSIEPYNNTWKFRVDKFQNLEALITCYIDVGINLLELQYFIAIQEYIHQLEGQQRGLLQIVERQVFESILPFDVFLKWENDKDLTPLTGKSVAMMTLMSCFNSLKEADDE